MLNLDGGPARVVDARFRFDLNADGAPDSVPLTEGDALREAGLLVDREDATSPC